MKNVLITGGAGFIGSNLVKSLLDNPKVGVVRVLDNLATGFLRNLDEFRDHPMFEFLYGDIRDLSTCQEAMQGIDLVSHQAALGSVPRSVKDPITTNAVNISGFVNIFSAAKDANVKRVVFAASSSTYGDSKELPKQEDKIGRPLSPYAVTKYVNELYAQVFSDLYNIEYIGLRYFNIFGPKQDPRGAYAAVIPLFMKAAKDNQNPKINGDGSFSRDFTHVDNAVQANTKALFTENSDATNEIYNIACGDRTTLNELWNNIVDVSGTKAIAEHGPERLGDIPHSLADISKAQRLLHYDPNVKITQGLDSTYQWFIKNIEKSTQI